MELNKYKILKIDDYKNDNMKNFDEHIYIFRYDGVIREEILKYKFNEKSYNYRMFVNFCLGEELFHEILKEYDIITPIPISKKRLKERGYNQSELIAKEISKKTKIQYEKNLLYKTKNTIAQSTLNKEQREENTKGVYELGEARKMHNKKILLVDDIYTTGSTVNECSKILKEAKPQKIGILTLAKD